MLIEIKTHGAKTLNIVLLRSVLVILDPFTFKSYKDIKYVNKLTFKIFKIINDELFTKLLNL